MLLWRSDQSRDAGAARWLLVAYLSLIPNLSLTPSLSLSPTLTLTLTRFFFVGGSNLWVTYHSLGNQAAPFAYAFDAERGSAAPDFPNPSPIPG